MPLVAQPGQTLGGDVGAPILARSLQQVEQVEADAALQDFVALDLDIGGIPEVCQVCFLLCCAKHRSHAELPGRARPGQPE